VQKTRPCRKCGRPRVGKNKTKDGKCRRCRLEYKKTHYRSNRAYYVWKGNKSKQKLVERNRRFVVAYLLVHPCVDCGEPDPLVLDFDHRDPEKKIMTVSLLVSRVRKERLIEEIEKCDVRCANCHRRKTAKQLRHVRYRILQEMRSSVGAG